MLIRRAKEDVQTPCRRDPTLKRAWALIVEKERPRGGESRVACTAKLLPEGKGTRRVELAESTRSHEFQPRARAEIFMAHALAVHDHSHRAS